MICGKVYYAVLCVAVRCPAGRYLLNRVCYVNCPLAYYAANVTSSSVTASQPMTVIGICSRCNSISVCADLLRILLIVVGIVSSVAIFVTVVVFACTRGVCRRQPTDASVKSIATDRLHSPRYITNGHILSGLSTRPLLAADSDSEFSDESEMPSDSATNANNV